MKLASYILMFTVLFLSVKPGIDAAIANEGQKSACNDSLCSATDQDNSSEDETENDLCNPFQICNSCLHFCTALPLQATHFSVFPTIQLFERQMSFSTEYLHEFWQPPKIEQHYS